jgi:DNA-binding NarL/FixJ family response regulator
MSKIKIAIADDHAIFRKGIVMVLDRYVDMKIMWEAEDGSALLKKIEKQTPDVLLMDINMPNIDGVEALPILKSTYPNLKIIFLSMFDSQEMVMRCVHNGANGFLSKNAEPGEIYNAIQDVVNDGYHFNDLLNAAIIMKLEMNKTVKRLVDVKPVEFSERELAVMRLTCEDKTTIQIADALHMSTKTVDAIRLTLKNKTGASSIAGLVVYAMRNNIFK